MKYKIGDWIKVIFYPNRSYQIIDINELNYYKVAENSEYYFHPEFIFYDISKNRQIKILDIIENIEKGGYH